ncbi:integrator complex subunit 8-like protein [Euroglyphus maynei]|uniref:Integrator complex subunit 8-like protein n=1 Tax=Euroglyphus maynei TaxID=6958 RepID=A0A1Y3BND5_EURMA|nr:integrator complex subunit 8-like protein [Euroglyphus maynei]
MAPIESSINDNQNQNMDTLWGTHSLWINLVIDPQSLNEEFINNHNESEIFDLMVYLIQNGITIQISIVSLHGSTNADDIQKRNIEMKKLYTVKFLLFKLLSHFRWCLPIIHANLPSVHQEFCFTEFKKFCEQEINVVPKEWRIFADLIYHRWIVYFEQKSTYPNKNTSKSNNNLNNPINLDPYSVSAEMQENLLKKVQTTCHYSVNEIEKYIKQLECNDIVQINVPTFDSLILKTDQKQDSEIHDEDVAQIDDDDPEFCMLQATDPDIILSLIPSIQRIPSLMNNKWNLNKFESILANFNTLSQTDLRKIQIILAKANELRQAKYFHESRVLYLSLLEDIQASQPMLAETIRYELLQTDLERFFFTNHKTKSKSNAQHRDLETKCIEFCRYIDKQKFVYFNELAELVCIFLIEYNYSNSMLEMINHPVDIIRFASLLCHLTVNSDSRENKAKEFWDFCLGSFILPTSKYANNFPRIMFSISLADFLCKLKNNTIAINMITTSLIKLYCTIKEHSLQQIMSICPKYYDLFPSSMSTNLINSIDSQLLNVTIDQTFRTYIRLLPEEIIISRYYAEFLMNENQYTQALKHFIEILMYQTNFFTCFDSLSTNNNNNESIIHQMIICSKKLDHHILAAILYQFMSNTDYGHAFKELSQNNFIDSSDDLYDCIWDITLLEYLINYHQRRGEDERKQKAIQLISQLDINSNNNIQIRNEAANLRKAKLFRMLAKQYL